MIRLGDGSSPRRSVQQWCGRDSGGSGYCGLSANLRTVHHVALHRAAAVRPDQLRTSPVVPAAVIAPAAGVVAVRDERRPRYRHRPGRGRWRGSAGHSGQRRGPVGQDRRHRLCGGRAVGRRALGRRRAAPTQADQRGVASCRLQFERGVIPPVGCGTESSLKRFAGAFALHRIHGVGRGSRGGGLGMHRCAWQHNACERHRAVPHGVQGAAHLLHGQRPCFHAS